MLDTEGRSSQYISISISLLLIRISQTALYKDILNSMELAVVVKDLFILVETNHVLIQEFVAVHMEIHQNHKIFLYQQKLIFIQRKNLVHVAKEKFMNALKNHQYAMTQEYVDVVMMIQFQKNIKIAHVAEDIFITVTMNLHFARNQEIVIVQQKIQVFFIFLYFFSFSLF